jgi:hypothetical protein
MQHLRVKIFARASADFRLGDAIAVFHRWIQRGALPELLVDVADYQHVFAGPGILLVGHDSHYGLDQRAHRLGLVYVRRTVAGGSDTDRVRAAIGAARAACALLAAEPEFAGKLEFDGSEIEVSVNDRLLAPNTAESFDALRSCLVPVLDEIWGPGGHAVAHTGEPRDLLTASARAARRE